MRYSFAFIVLLVSELLSAQRIYYTRQAPWQQRVDYTIQVKLNDSIHELSANEMITYTNHSPDTLKLMYFHLWPNAYRNNETEFAKQKLQNKSVDFYYSSADSKGKIDSLSFKVNGEKVNGRLLDSIDICLIELPQPLPPGGQIIISTPFRVKIPDVFSRLGHEGQLYCITQWYPKPAVYDVNGWNYMPYLDEGEFYSEFGKFDVSISVPENYVIAATGELQNEEEKEWIETRMKYKKVGRNTGVHNKDKTQFPNSSIRYKTLRFIQDSIHDFAWFADKRFHIDKSLVKLKSGKTVKTYFYHIDPTLDGVKWIDSAVLFYSRLVGEYPYNSATAVVTPLKAGAGMEYPMITNVDGDGQGVIVHEVGHNWFYGILANNERIYPWMDESFNNYYETRFEYKKEPAIHSGIRPSVFLNKEKQIGIGGAIGESPFGILQMQYLLSSRNNSDQPIGIPAPEFTDLNYGTIIYSKAPLAFHHLQEYLGDSTFDTLMHLYFEKWKFRHPLPDDFFDHLRSVTGKNQDWFIKDLFETTKKPDYKIMSYSNGVIAVKNNSSVVSPFPISRMKGDSVISTNWFEGFMGKKRFNLGNFEGDKIRIDAFETTVDVYRENNTIRTRGLFKSMQPIRFRLLGDMENPYVNQIFISPIIGANLYNKGMLGLAVYNSLLPQKKYEYSMTPMYSFGTNDVVGYASFQRHFSTEGTFSQVHIGADMARFATEYTMYYSNSVTYNKIAPFIRFDLSKQNPRSPFSQKIECRSVLILYQKNKNTNNENPYQDIFPGNARIDEINYSFTKNTILNKNSASVTFQNISDQGNFIKIFGEFNQSFNYDQPKKKFDIRLFGGAFLQSDVTKDFIYQFRSNGNMGWNDYTFDQSLMGRSKGQYDANGIFSHQLITTGANLHLPCWPAYSSSTNSWIFSANLSSTLPGPLPIRIFADFAFLNESSYAPQVYQTINTPVFQYVAGLKWVVAEDIFEIYFPLVNSVNIEDSYKDKSINPSYNDENAFEHLARKMTFIFNINKINPLKIVRGITF